MNHRLQLFHLDSHHKKDKSQNRAQQELTSDHSKPLNNSHDPHQYIFVNLINDSEKQPVIIIGWESKFLSCQNHHTAEQILTTLKFVVQFNCPFLVLFSVLHEF